MKISKIIPIYIHTKRVDNEDDNNYSLIAITSAVAKVYEKIFLARLDHHLQINNFVSPHAA